MVDHLSTVSSFSYVMLQEGEVALKKAPTRDITTAADT